MENIFSRLILISGLLAAPALYATPISSCAPDFSSCNIYEDGMVLNLPGIAISGDVIITEAGHPAVVSDVFRIFNDFSDSGGGTGLGTTAFLFSADLANLPNPSTYSVNAVTMPEGATIVSALCPGGIAKPCSETIYNGNGTLYNIFSSAAPEPGTLVLLGLGVGLIFLRQRRSV
jgi:hypothetical protein